MRKCLFIAPMMALSLSGCGLAQRAITAPGQVAQHTAIDEETLRRCEATYKLTGIIIDFGLDADLIKGSVATTVAGIDRELYGKLEVCRTAYRLFNTAELKRAADEMDAKSNDAIKAAKGGE